MEDAKNYGQMMKSSFRTPYMNYPYSMGMENQGMMNMPKYQAPYYAPSHHAKPNEQGYSGSQNNNFSNPKNEAHGDLFNNPK